MHCPSCNSTNSVINGELVICEDCLTIVDDAIRCPDCGDTFLREYKDGTTVCYGCGNVTLDTGYDAFLCRHYFQAVTFPSGTTVFASSLLSPRNRRKEETPSFGVYLAREWRPVSMSLVIPWTDYGLPRVPMGDVLSAADTVLDRAQFQAVEIGCYGGHGRTGTFLAILAGLENVPNPVEWVRGNYCSQSVETPMQAWYAEAVLAFSRDEELPPRPQPPKPKKKGKKTTQKKGKK